jgi:hypothetical protein
VSAGDLLPVTQADRDAAADIWRDYIARVGECIAERGMRAGQLDDGLPSLLARHRLAASNSYDKAIREAVDTLDALVAAWVEGREVSDEEGRHATGALFALNRYLTERPANGEWLLVPREPDDSKLLDLARKCEFSDDAAAIELGELLIAILDPQWINWDGGAASIPQGTGWIQFSGESRSDALNRAPSELSHWPWFGEDRRPGVVAYRMLSAIPSPSEGDRG